MKDEGKQRSKREELQGLLIQLESDRKRLDALSRQSQLVESASLELRSTIGALNSLKENKVGTEILVSLGSDSFVKATVGDNERVLVGVGAKVSVEKTVDEAVDLLEARGEELSKTRSKLNEGVLELNQRITELNHMAEHLMAEINSPKK